MDGYDKGGKDKDQEDMWEECFHGCAINEIGVLLIASWVGSYCIWYEGGGDKDKDEDAGIVMTCWLLCSLYCVQTRCH